MKSRVSCAPRRFDERVASTPEEAYALHYRLPDEAGTKIGGDWFSDPNSTCCKHGSRSSARKAASAQIAKIPFELSRHIASVYKPAAEVRGAA